MDTVPLLWFTVKDPPEVCHLSMWGKARTPISRITQEPSLSLASFTRWMVVHPLRFAYSDSSENPSGLCSSECVRYVRVGFRLCSGGIVTYRLTK
ncbi:hypothetical protein [Synechococcus sp. PCC 7335]|uniref:hypothetical protein n=1 Tax=Synechococcus sp. (strain ATCC 29403 / PCC 7335) TaxID=91464 RepID=UPI0018DEA33E|nr:hypothetical protein [Synechococcus sp. PCC 7335]